MRAGQVLSLQNILQNSTSCTALSISQDAQWYQRRFVWRFILGSIHAHDVWQCLCSMIASFCRPWKAYADPRKHMHHWQGIICTRLMYQVLAWWSLQTAFSSSNVANSGATLLTTTLMAGIRCAVLIFWKPKLNRISPSWPGKLQGCQNKSTEHKMPTCSY